MRAGFAPGEASNPRDLQHQARERVPDRLGVGLMAVGFLFLARKLRERTEEALTLAETFRDPEAQRMKLEITERYEKLAQRLENDG